MTSVNRIKSKICYITEYFLLERHPWLRIEEYRREGIDLVDIHHLIRRIGYAGGRALSAYSVMTKDPYLTPGPT